MKVILTGATGYIGRATVPLLVERGHTVVAVIRPSSTSPLPPEVERRPIDLGDAAAVAQLAASGDAFVNLGFASHGRAWPEAVAVESELVRALVTRLQGSSVRLVVANGTAFYGDGGGRWLEETQAVRAEHPAAGRAQATLPVTTTPGLQGTELRFASFVYGHGGSVFLPVLVEAALTHGKIPVIDGGKKRLSAVHVDDAARAVVAALESDAQGVFHIASDESPNLARLAEALALATRAALTPMSTEEAAELTDPFTALFLDLDNRLSSRRARSELGWMPAANDSLLWDVAFGSYARRVSRA